jgi:hydrogenase nickel incorporation protein HypA/HybF
MHELALSQSIIDLVVECACREGLRSVSRVVLQVGVAAGVEAEALRFCFGALAEQTLAEGAELAIVPVSLRARCRHCGETYAPASLIAPCPDCGSHERMLVAGRELQVEAIEGE